MTDAPRRSLAFTQAASLVQTRIRKAGESRGFAVTRLLTHWSEIAGPDVARVARPVNVSYGRDGFGATLTVLTTGPHAPVLEMEKDRLRDRVNACYGYRAIARVRITQTAPTGFAEGQAQFGPAPADPGPKAPPPAIVAQAQAVAADVQDTELRLALAALAANVLTKSHS